MQIFCKKIKRLKTVKIISAKAAGFKTLKIAESIAGAIQIRFPGSARFIKRA